MRNIWIFCAVWARSLSSIRSRTGLFRKETDLLYLPGGYPENRLEELARARLARESIRSYIEAGGRTLAECGGDDISFAVRSF